MPSPTDIRPPFTADSARAKVQAAEDAWNSRDPERVSLAYTVDSQWRNRDQFFVGREAIQAFLQSKWEKELDYRLMKELWAFTDNRISVRFEYEWHDSSGQWYRTHGNEHWEFDETGLMRRRDMSANDMKISKGDTAAPSRDEHSIPDRSDDTTSPTPEVFRSRVLVPSSADLPCRAPAARRRLEHDISGPGVPRSIKIPRITPR